MVLPVRGRSFAIALIALATLVAVYARFITLPGNGDIDIWLDWMSAIGNQGTTAAYQSMHHDYPPGAFVALSVTSHVSEIVKAAPLLALKSMIAISAFAGAMVFVAWTGNVLQTAALLSALAANAAALGYLDALVLAPLLLALMALQRRQLVAAGFFYALAISLKWQPLIIAPFVIVEACGVSPASEWRAWRDGLARILTGMIAGTAIFLLAFDPASIWSGFRAALAHNSLSFQALNANWIVQMILYVAVRSEDALFEVAVPNWLALSSRLIFAAAYGLVLLAFILRRSRDYGDFVWFACLGFFTYCTLGVGVHENHLFVAMVLAFSLLAVRHPAGWSMALYLAVASNINLLLFSGIDGHVRMNERMPFAYAPVIVWSIIASLANTLWWILCFSRSVFPVLVTRWLHRPQFVDYPQSAPVSGSR
jgi:hypothetical protein